jgi:hypothetical protein
MHPLKSKSWVSLLLQRQPDHARRATVHTLHRYFYPDERAIVETLLQYSDPHRTGFKHQLEVARVKRQCSCGCPSLGIFIPQQTLPAEGSNKLVAAAIGIADGGCVSVMLFQSEGYLASLNVLNLEPINKPYGLPRLDSLKPYLTF